nr:ankyrin repeat-containing protein [Quercus suber]
MEVSNSSKALRFITYQPFFSTVRSGDLGSLKQLLDKLSGDDPSDTSTISDLMALQNDAGETALFLAAANNLHEIFSYLLSFSDIQTLKIRSNSDMDAFHIAAKLGHLGMLLSTLNS